MAITLSEYYFDFVTRFRDETSGKAMSVLDMLKRAFHKTYDEIEAKSISKQFQKVADAAGKPEMLTELGKFSYALKNMGKSNAEISMITENLLKKNNLTEFSTVVGKLDASKVKEVESALKNVATALDVGKLNADFESLKVGLNSLDLGTQETRSLFNSLYHVMSEGGINMEALQSSIDMLSGDLSAMNPEQLKRLSVSATQSAASINEMVGKLKEAKYAAGTPESAAKIEVEIQKLLGLRDKIGGAGKQISESLGKVNIFQGILTASDPKVFLSEMTKLGQKSTLAISGVENEIMQKLTDSPEMFAGMGEEGQRALAAMIQGYGMKFSAEQKAVMDKLIADFDKGLLTGEEKAKAEAYKAMQAMTAEGAAGKAKAAGESAAPAVPAGRSPIDKLGSSLKYLGTTLAPFRMITEVLAPLGDLIRSSIMPALVPLSFALMNIGHDLMPAVITIIRALTSVLLSLAPVLTVIAKVIAWVVTALDELGILKPLIATILTIGVALHLMSIKTIFLSQAMIGLRAALTLIAQHPVILVIALLVAGLVLLHKWCPKLATGIAIVGVALWAISKHPVITAISLVVLGFVALYKACPPLAIAIAVIGAALWGLAANPVVTAIALIVVAVAGLIYGIIKLVGWLNRLGVFSAIFSVLFAPIKIVIGLIKSVWGWLGKVTGLGSGLKLALVAIFAPVIIPIIAIVKGVKALWEWFGKLGKMGEVLKTAFLILLGPIGAIIAGVRLAIKLVGWLFGRKKKAEAPVEKSPKAEAPVEKSPKAKASHEAIQEKRRLELIQRGELEKETPTTPETAAPSTTSSAAPAVPPSQTTKGLLSGILGSAFSATPFGLMKNMLTKQTALAQAGQTNQQITNKFLKDVRDTVQEWRASSEDPSIDRLASFNRRA